MSYGWFILQVLLLLLWYVYPAFAFVPAWVILLPTIVFAFFAVLTMVAISFAWRWAP